ncbi:hypothetical protein FNYG_08837 [Fusarium nygamai]|uniref:Uncharacterized protein n=1 Tax=Gibberella nygamai TaxID=42673 RepID=A0A2K0W680_GIBNY|nr:hypothetical protein FNYG_08837 [Fusarium nygamai]
MAARTNSQTTIKYIDQALMKLAGCKQRSTECKRSPRLPQPSLFAPLFNLTPLFNLNTISSTASLRSFNSVLRIELALPRVCEVPSPSSNHIPLFSLKNHCVESLIRSVNSILHIEVAFFPHPALTHQSPRALALFHSCVLIFSHSTALQQAFHSTSMSSMRFNPSSHPSSRSKDVDYQRLFSKPLALPGSTISYEGYIRALQLYGREDQLTNSHKVTRYDRWVARNSALHQAYQEQALRDGYNPIGGSSNAFTGVYYPNPPSGGPSLNQADTDPDIPLPRGPKRRRQAASTEDFSETDTMAPGTRNSAPVPNAFAYHIGNIKAKAGQSAQNAIGAAENSLLLGEVVKKFINAEITPELRQQVSSILTTMGDIEGLATTVKTIRAEQTPEPSSQFGSALRAIHYSGDSIKNVDRPVDGATNPIDLTKPSSARKRRRVTESTHSDSDDEEVTPLYNFRLQN